MEKSSCDIELPVEDIIHNAQVSSAVVPIIASKSSKDAICRRNSVFHMSDALR
jgi:hypothetical protein